MIYHIKDISVSQNRSKTQKNDWKSYFTYRLRHLLDILSIFKELEKRLWSRAVSVSFGGIFADD